MCVMVYGSVTVHSDCVTLKARMKISGFINNFHFN